MVTLEVSDRVSIVNIDSLGTTCGRNNGAVTNLLASGYPDSYSLDGINYFSNPLFDSLAAGTYQYYARNNDCADTMSFSIGGSSVPELQIAAIDGTSCGEANGSVELGASGGNGDYEFLLDTLASQSGLFDSLPSGSYIAFVEDMDDCVDSDQVNISSSTAVSLAANVVDGFCDEPGTLQLIAMGGDGDYEFGDSDQAYSTLSTFGVQETGEYTFYLRDSEGCLDSITERVEVFAAPEIQIDILQEALCEEPVGEVLLTGSLGKAPLSYALQGESFASATRFSNLSEGVKTFEVRDSSGCMTEWSVDMPATPRIRVEDLSAEQLFCGDFLSAVSFTPAGGTGELTHRLTDSAGNVVDEAGGLPEGQYRLTVTDELGCEQTELIIVRKEECQMYIPTAFNPLSAGEDRKFKIGVPAASDFMIETFQIYDRWGNLVYDKKDIDPLTFTEWWDGTFNDGTEVEAGVYVYLLQLGSQGESISGSITVVR